MVERTVSLGLAGRGISSVRETLFTQQELLQKLQQELDDEREASATAASEALSMILKLQGEKAVLEMEASQHKRMADEKMCHVETSLAFFEDLIYQKEMEIASLEFQVQAYRCKLLSLGCADTAVTENNKSMENMMLQSDDFFFTETPSANKIRRLQSFSFLVDDVGDEKITPADSDFVPADKEIIDESMDPKKGLESPSPSTPQDLNSCWDQIKKINGCVREISDFRYCHKENKNTMLRRESYSRALVSQVSNSILESAKSDIASIMERMKNSEKPTAEEGSTDLPSSSSNVQDIFEFPQSKVHSKSSSDEEKGEMGNFKMVVHQTNLERKSSKPPRYLSIRKDPLRNIGFTDCQAELQQMKERIERLQGERTARSTTQETNQGRKGEELSLLKEIREQLNSIQLEMRSLRPLENQSRSPPPHDLSFLSLKEAMMHFWF